MSLRLLAEGIAIGHDLAQALTQPCLALPQEDDLLQQLRVRGGQCAAAGVLEVRADLFEGHDTRLRLFGDSARRLRLLLFEREATAQLLGGLEGLGKLFANGRSALSLRQQRPLHRGDELFLGAHLLLQHRNKASALGRGAGRKSIG